MLQSVGRDHLVRLAERAVTDSGRILLCHLAATVARAENPPFRAINQMTPTRYAWSRKLQRSMCPLKFLFARKLPRRPGALSNSLLHSSAGVTYVSSGTTAKAAKRWLATSPRSAGRTRRVESRRSLGSEYLSFAPSALVFDFHSPPFSLAFDHCVDALTDDRES